MRIVLAGGGTAGSVTPLLAVAQKLEDISGRKLELLWLGTKYGPEKKLLDERGIKFKPIFSGKLRRYFSWRNLFDPVLIIVGFIQSLSILTKSRPDFILSAGSFASVPAVWAGWLLRIPSLIHQQDVVPGLANKLMAPFARKITVTFEKSLKDFSKGKTIWTGNPVRDDLLKGERSRAEKLFNLESGLPCLLVLGGSTGALKLNELIIKIVPELVQFCQVIHIAGGKMDTKYKIENARYHLYDFLTKEMADAYAAADLVVSRAGMGTLTELAILAKPVILIPIPNSHQEKNASVFAERGAAMLVSQKEVSSQKLLAEIKTILSHKSQLAKLSENIRKVARPKAAEEIARIVLENV